MKSFLMFVVLSVAIASAQMYDRVTVNLPYTVTIGDKTLPPGEYLIRQMSPTSGNRVLAIFQGDQRKHEATVITIPTLDNRTPEDTKVVLHKFGDDYYFDKIWIQGKNYGYEFVLPDDVKSRMRERTMTAATLPARYESSSETQEKSAAQTTASSDRPASEKTSADRTAVSRERTTVTERSSTRSESEVKSDSSLSARADAKPEPPVARAEPAQPADPAPSSQIPPTTATPRDAPDAQQPVDRFPDTSGNWLTLLISGGALAAAGMLARKRG